MLHHYPNYIRLFLFQTAFPSGAEPEVPPFAAANVRGLESRRPLPVFATRRGLGPPRAAAGAATVGVLMAPFSPALIGVPVVTPFAARKVLLTETALKVVGFLMVDAVRVWPRPSTDAFDVSGLVPSVSDPPLTLTSAELTVPSTRSVSDLISSPLASPFIFGVPAVTSWLLFVMGVLPKLAKKRHQLETSS